MFLLSVGAQWAQQHDMQVQARYHDHMPELPISEQHYFVAATHSMSVQIGWLRLDSLGKVVVD